MQDTKQSVMKSGSLNPMHCKHHTDETKKKISYAQKARYDRIRKALKEQDILTYGKTDDEARKDVLKQLLDRNELNFRSVQQAVNFLSIMLRKNRIQEIIKEEINNFIQNSTRLVKIKTKESTPQSLWSGK